MVGLAARLAEKLPNIQKGKELQKLMFNQDPLLFDKAHYNT